MIGKTFQRLYVVSQAPSKNGRRMWCCKCVCGNTTTVATSKLRNGHTQSCGCLQRERASVVGKQTVKYARAAILIHGRASNDPTYVTWKKMRQRCQDLNAHNYKYYGGRGIKICERWLESFENFLTDMGERPEGKTLDRYPNNNGDYEPGNCRWATQCEQVRNSRRYLHAT